MLVAGDLLALGDVDPGVRAQRVAGALLKAALGVRARAEDRVEVGEVSEAHLRADLVQRDDLALGGVGDPCDRLAHRRGDAQVALLLQLAEQPPVQCVQREVPDRLVVQRLDELQPPGLCERLAHERTRPDRKSIAGAQFNGVGGPLAGLLAAPAVKLAPDEPPRFDRANGRAGQRAEVVVARLAQRGLDLVAERSLGEFFLGSLRLHHEAAVVAAVLRPDEERDQARQDHALEQVVALHGGEHACRVLARENLAAEAVAPADERSDALGGQQREAHAPHRDRAVLRAPGAVRPRQPEGRVGDDLRDLHAQLAQHRKGALHVAGDRVIVAGP